MKTSRFIPFFAAFAIVSAILAAPALEAREPIAVNQFNFRKKVLNTDKLVVLEFWADWCAACHLVEPIVEELSDIYDRKVTFAKVDGDRNPGLSRWFGVKALPTIIFIKEGEVVDGFNGAPGKEEFEAAILRHL
mgnify:CR=1 FL=1